MIYISVRQLSDYTFKSSCVVFQTVDSGTLVLLFLLFLLDSSLFNLLDTCWLSLHLLEALLLLFGGLVDGEAGSGLVLTEIADGLALVVAGHVHTALEDGKRSAVLPDLDLDVGRVLELLSLEVPADLRLRIASEARLESCAHSILDSGLFDLTNKLGRLLRSC